MEDLSADFRPGLIICFFRSSRSKKLGPRTYVTVVSYQLYNDPKSNSDLGIHLQVLSLGHPLAQKGKFMTGTVDDQANK
jgi:hypothetical protein